MTILQVNLRRKGKKFLMSGLLFGFCMARITACTMRLVWSTHLTNIAIAIAAQIFVAAGVIILFIVNLIFTQRIIRSSHPEFAWTKWFSLAFKLYYASVIVMLIALITCTVQSFYTLNTNTRRIDRDVQLVGATYFAVTAFLPIPLLTLNYLLPRSSKVEKFGQGRHRTKVFFVLATATLLSLGAAFRAGTAYIPRPSSDPAWYDSKACFYLFDFTIEVIVVYTYAIIRVDKRFHVPNGSKRAGDYSGSNDDEPKQEPSPIRASFQEHGKRQSFLSRVMTEEEVFDDEEDTSGRQGKEHNHNDVEAGMVSPTTTTGRRLSSALTEVASGM